MTAISPESTSPAAEENPAAAVTVEENAAAAIAATVAGVEGVHTLGGALTRAADALRQRVHSTPTTAGVTVHQDRSGHVAVTVSIVVDYPHKIRDVVHAVRDAARAVAAETGFNNVDVTVIVTDVFGPFDTDTQTDTEE